MCAHDAAIVTDGNYRGPRLAAEMTRTGTWQPDIVERKDVPRCEVLPKRWTAERTFSWLGHHRCLAHYFERQIRSVVAFIRLAMIRIMLRRIAASPSK